MSEFVDSQLVDYLSDVFERYGAVQTRRMFSGYGIYRDNLMTKKRSKKP